MKLTKHQKKLYTQLKGGTIKQYEPLSSYKSARYVGFPADGSEAVSVNAPSMNKFSAMGLLERIEYTPLIITYRVLEEPK